MQQHELNTMQTIFVLFPIKIFEHNQKNICAFGGPS